MTTGAAPGVQKVCGLLLVGVCCVWGELVDVGGGFVGGGGHSFNFFVKRDIMQCHAIGFPPRRRHAAFCMG